MSVLSSIHWGDVSSWFAGLLTVGVLWQTNRGLRAEAARARLDRQDHTDAEARSQAELIASWTDHLSLDPQDYSDALQQWRGDQPVDTSPVGAVLFIRIGNASQLPVYGLAYRLAAGSRGTFIDSINVIPPRTVAEVVIPLPSAPRSGDPQPDITFIDVRNCQWSRSADGLLTKGWPSDPFVADPGGHPGQHPTADLPRPVRFGSRTYSESTGTTVGAPQPPAVW